MEIRTNIYLKFCLYKKNKHQPHHHHNEVKKLGSNFNTLGMLFLYKKFHFTFSIIVTIIPPSFATKALILILLH
jgi:hypothetical protein